MEGLIGAFMKKNSGRSVLGCGRTDCKRCSSGGCKKTQTQREGITRARTLLWKGKSDRKATAMERLSQLVEVEKILRKSQNTEEASKIVPFIELGKQLVFSNSVQSICGYMATQFDESLLTDKKQPWKRRSSKIIKRITEQKLFELLMDKIEAHPKKTNSEK